MPRKTSPQDKARPPFRSIPFLLLLPLAAALLFSSADAATRYVKPSSEVPVRSGQGTDFKILAVVPDGMEVEFLEEADSWAKIRTPGGTEGWLLKRYLTSDPPPSIAIAALQAEKARLEETNDEISRRNSELSASHDQREQELNLCRIERDEAVNNYETLRKNSADVIELQNKLTGTNRDLQRAQENLTALEMSTRGARQYTSLKWFLAGGLLVLCGWAMGLVSARSRKRKTTLY